MLEINNAAVGQVTLALRVCVREEASLARHSRIAHALNFGITIQNN
jgi:hypothetical protein